MYLQITILKILRQSLYLEIIIISYTNLRPGVDFTKGFKTWHKFSTEIRFMLIPIIVLFIAHEFITGNFDITGKHRAVTEHSTKIYLWPSSVLNTFVKHTPDYLTYTKCYVRVGYFVQKKNRLILFLGLFIQLPLLKVSSATVKSLYTPNNYVYLEHDRNRGWRLD